MLLFVYHVLLYKFLGILINSAIRLKSIDDISNSKTSKDKADKINSNDGVSAKVMTVNLSS